MITASSLQRRLACPGSNVLPRAENHSEWATLGHEAHEELSHFDDLPPNVARHMPANARSEVKLAFCVATGVGRIIGTGSDRAYGDVGPFEIVGSTDVMALDGDAVVIADFKTGFNAVEPAATNAQLAFYALAACRAHGLNRAIVRIIYTKTGRCDEAELDALDLANFASRLRELHTRVAKMTRETSTTNEGAWCKHCASVPFCASKNALLVQVAERGLAVVGDSELTPARAAAGYEQIVRVEQLIRDARKRLETYVDENGPIDLGDGRKFGRYVRNGNERLSGDVAVKAIAEIVGESAKEFETIAIERRTSKAAIDRAAKALGAKKGTGLAIVKRIRELGGATNAPETMPLGEYTDAEPAEKASIDYDAINAQLSAGGAK